MSRVNQKEVKLILKQNYHEFCLLSFSYVACMNQSQDIVRDVFVELLINAEVMDILNLKDYISKLIRNRSIGHATTIRKMESVKQNIFVIDENNENQNKDSFQAVV